MNAAARHEELNAITERIIACAYKVSNTLGCGFLEKVYENALAIELARLGLQVEQQNPIDVYYEDAIVGKYFADLLVDAAIIVEVKAVKAIEEIHHAQALNYLKATGHRIALVLNFGTPKLEIKRLVRNF